MKFNLIDSSALNRSLFQIDPSTHSKLFLFLSWFFSGHKKQLRLVRYDKVSRKKG